MQAEIDFLIWITKTIMTTKAAQLKQTLCFRSLRLMDKDYVNTNLNSFSDSEIEERDRYRENNFTKLKRSSSENCLILHNKENASDIKISPNISENNKSPRSETSENVQFIAKKSSNKVSPSELKKLKTDTEKISINNQGDSVPEMSNPYQVLESSNISETVNENLLGEPRCLALKKYSGDFNPFLTDDSLVFEPDFESENFGLDEKTTRNKKQEVSENPHIKDMFVDDEVAVPCKKKSSTHDREEGELSPETHQAVLETNKENDASTKLNAEFFQKINECLLDLDKKCREFYSSSTPKGAMKYLQRTLSNVDSIKRKLTFLISSKNSESEKKKKLRKIVEKYYISKSTSAKESERNSASRHSRSNRQSSENKSGTHSSRLEEHKNADGSSREYIFNERDKELSHRFGELGKKLDESNHEKKSESNSKYGHRKRSSQDKHSQAYLLNRKKVDILEKLGTKKEIERIKSLFERQMSLITKHVIQKKESNKGQSAEKYRRHHSSQKENHENKELHEKVDLNELKTLEDMEAFLDTLKNRTNDKILSEQFIRNERKKKLLMFTSKRDKNIGLVQRSDKITPLAPAVELVGNSNTILENLLHKESCSAVSINPQKNQMSDTGEFKEKEVGSENISKDNTIKETPNVSKKIKETCSVHLLSAQLSKQKASEQVKSDYDKRHHRELNHAHLEGDVDALKLEKSCITAKETEGNSSKKSRHKIRNTSDIDQKGLVEGKRMEEIDSKYEEPEIEKEKRATKRKRSSEYPTSSKKPKENDTNLETGNSQSVLGLDSEKVTDETSNSLIKDLLTKKIFILDDNNLAMNNQFCLKVIDNEVYLKKISSRRKHKRSRKKSKHHETKKVEETLFEQPKEKLSEEQQDSTDTKNANLEDMENFLQELRSKKKVCDEDDKMELTRSNPQCKELKFLAKIRAKRKAKLMACVSEDANASEKEAKFLKSLEKREGDLSDSSDIESRKQKLMEKMRAEVDAIVFAEKPSAKFTDDDPLRDVKTFLNIIKEAESVNDESSKQVYVSFSLKRSDVKRLESLTSGKPSSLTDESQKFLNSVRAKMRAKKTPASNISSLMQKPEE